MPNPIVAIESITRPQTVADGTLEANIGPDTAILQEKARRTNTGSPLAAGRHLGHFGMGNLLNNLFGN